MAAQRSLGHYSESDVLSHGEFLTVMDVSEHHWLLEHSHDFPEMVCVLGGKGTQYINGISLPIKEGDLYIIPVGTTHVFRPVIGAAGDSELKVRDVIIRSQWLEGLIVSVPDQEVSEFVKWLLHKPNAAATDSPAWIKVTDEQGRLRRVTENLKELLCDKPPLYRTRLAAGMLELLAALCTASRCGRLQEAEWPSSAESDPVKREIVLAVQAIPLRDVTLVDAAGRLHMSPRHLSRIFPSYFGRTFKMYVQELRIKESRKLLRHSSLTVKEIMEQVGCKDAEHFYREFKRRTGLTPGHYRRFPALTESE